MRKNSLVIKILLKKRIRLVFEKLRYDCVPDGQSYYLRYEFFDLLYMLDHFGVVYDEDFMFRYLDRLNKIVLDKYKCTDYIGV